jgi:hypothetical protein
MHASRQSTNPSEFPGSRDLTELAEGVAVFICPLLSGAVHPESNPYRGDIVGRIFEDMLSGSLRREDVRSRVNAYIAEFNRLYPTKYAKFGDSQLLSLDEVLFDSGSTTRGDTISHGLWD